MKTFVATSFAALLAAATPLAAQTTTTPPPNAGTATQNKETPSATSTQTQWYTHQSGEMRASKLIGTAVKNNAGETVGDVNEVLLDKDGKVAAVILGVGGFLGMGERQVAVSFQSLHLTTNNNNNTVVSMDATKDTLKAAPEWKWSSDAGSSTTGTSTPPATKPSR